MTEIQSNKSLLRALHDAAGRRMTPEEIREQRISFVISTLDEGSEFSREDIAKIIDEKEGKAA